jgi:hypothetical protein
MSAGINVNEKKEREDDIKVVGGWISSSDFNRMKKKQRCRVNAALRRLKIRRVVGNFFGI